MILNSYTVSFLCTCRYMKLILITIFVFCCSFMKEPVSHTPESRVALHKHLSEKRQTKYN